MKRIIFLLLTLQILLTSVCNAFEPPDPSRWLWIGKTNDKNDYWIDPQSINYEISNLYNHDKHKQVEVWVMFHDSTNRKIAKQRSVYDLSCNQFKINSSLLFDENNTLLNSLNLSYRDFESIPPESIAERILQTCQYFWDNDSRNTVK